MENNNLSAVINCGSSTIRLIVAQKDSSGRISILDSAINYIGLGRDVFSNGLIRKKTMTQAIGVFIQYRQMLHGWGIKTKQTKVIGTSALREAKNRDTFVDRLEVRTGFQIQIIDGLEENRLTYLAVQHALHEEFNKLSKVNSLIIEVGAGTTEIMLLRRGLMTAVHSLSFGAVRVEEQFRSNHSGMGISSTTLTQNLRPMRDLVASELRPSTIRTFIAVGNYAKIAAQAVGTPYNSTCMKVERKDWEALALKVHSMTPEACVKELGVSYLGLAGLSSALLAFSVFLQGTSAEFVLVPTGGNAEGLLMELGENVDPEVAQRFNDQVISSAVSMGKKYHFDLKHAQLVAKLSLSLFDQLQNEHQMGVKERLLLHVGAILHDVGTYIRPSGHHKHGMYLVLNAEIFGLSPQDVRVVANVVRYHRKSMPNSSQPGYASLSREDRIRVLKLASILRVADALDRGHTQKVRSIRAQKSEDELILKTDYTGDMTAERFSLENKGYMFEEVFGLKVVLVS